jgi:hypothetical protein
LDMNSLVPFEDTAAEFLESVIDVDSIAANAENCYDLRGHCHPNPRQQVILGETKQEPGRSGRRADAGIPSVQAHLRQKSWSTSNSSNLPSHS